MEVKFVIPNRDDPNRARELYQKADVVAIPREGEIVYLRDNEDSSGTPWMVHHIIHKLIVPLDEGLARAHQIKIHLIEPGSWSRQ